MLNEMWHEWRGPGMVSEPMLHFWTQRFNWWLELQKRLENDPEVEIWELAHVEERLETAIYHIVLYFVGIPKK